MPAALTLLDGVRWQGEVVVGERPQALLAALAEEPRGPSVERLVEEVWADDRPAHPTKALQVLVSRVRAATAADVVERTPTGYRLGVARADVDALAQADLVADARAAYAAGRHDDAVRAADAALALGGPGAPGADGALASVRRRSESLRAEASLVGAMAASRAGDHAAALAVLERAAAQRPDDEELLDCLLRSEAVVRGHAAALARYDGHRTRLLERLGASPGAALQRTYGELLAQDAPVRSGLRYDATDLVGRDDDVAALRELVRRSRVTSVVGAGGLGKTRLAQLLARTAEQPVVHVVELVGVTSPDDVVAEVGSALGVRESVGGRSRLTPEQRADVRTRIAHQLDTAPSLLVLDNCEHLVEAVADLVASLVASTRDLRVLTTTRAPLGIAAERVYPLGALAPHDAAALFVQRARAARPSVRLDDAVVAELVGHLDGLPLAVELAAARVRAMSVEEVLRRLGDRFALLRGGDRGAPDRHQTLLAVIDWSWNLLAEPERRALRRLSVFHDGFGLDGAEAVTGTVDDPLDAVAQLVDQSLLDVAEGPDGLRYRMLETVREFGRVQLAAAGESAETEDAQRRWAVDLATRASSLLRGPHEADGVRLVRPEDANLADVLRQVLAAGDAASAVVLVGALGRYWTIVGDHQRVISVVAAVEGVLADWEPPPHLLDPTREVLATLSTHAVLFGAAESSVSVDRLAQLGAVGADDRVSAQVRVVLALAGHRDTLAALTALVDDPDRLVRLQALGWAGHFQENEGDPQAAARSLELALTLWREEDGPSAAAGLRAQLASIWMQVGDLEAAERHARAALVPLREVGAVEDELEVRALLALVDLHRGRLDDAAAAIAELEHDVAVAGGIGSTLVVAASRAELSLARGDVEEGVRRYDEAMTRLRGVRPLGRRATDERGYEPWTVFGEASSASARALLDDDPVGRELAAALVPKAARLVEGRAGRLDYPIVGLVLYALAVWQLKPGGAGPATAARLLVHAEVFGANRSSPSMSWSRITGPVEAAEPGLLDRLRADVAGRRAPELRRDVLDVLAEL
ncbi:ATP-binding protein [Solicola sp. PLA-1-18]|uniref:ATP-binding protein n=1 Tax=Solicola sp. PLA-1-18 TaxID=3380532 RepID=UPI003B7786E6